MVEWAVTGTIVFEKILAAFRRLAHNELANKVAAAPRPAE